MLKYGKGGKMLTFNLKKEWFDKIKSGEKTHEYREVKPYWTKRILKCTQEVISKRREMCANLNLINNPEEIDNLNIPIKIIFKCGYPKPTEKNKILHAEMISIEEINGKHTDLAINKNVYDIEFKLVRK